MTRPAPDCVTQLEYYCVCDSSWHVFSDQATIVGVSLTNCSTIIRQNIIDHSLPLTIYAANQGKVYTIAVDEPNNTLFAGGENNEKTGQVVQYDLGTGQSIKTYFGVGIGSIESSTRAGNLLLFGGFESYKVAIIDSVNRRIVHESINTAIRNIFSMTIFTLFESNNQFQILLLCVGEIQMYSNGRTDLFDITELIKKYSNLYFEKEKALDALGEDSVEDK